MLSSENLLDGKHLSCQMCGISRFTNQLCLKVIQLCEMLRQIMSCQVQSLETEIACGIFTLVILDVIPGSLILG